MTKIHFHLFPTSKHVHVHGGDGTFVTPRASTRFFVRKRAVTLDTRGETRPFMRFEMCKTVIICTSKPKNWRVETRKSASGI